MKERLVSIIIPCKSINAYARECIDGCLRLDYKKFEIIVLPDKKEIVRGRRLRIISTGNVKPSVKRNIGMEKARGSIYAFIDSDAVPEKDWLKNTARHLVKEDIAMVGGPNLTPRDADFFEQIVGEILAMPICTGELSMRYKISKKRYVKELMSCNFIVKKEHAVRFEPGLLTGEDLKFCSDIRKKGGKILYAPGVIVYHHRRNTLKGHLKQMMTYGRDRALVIRREWAEAGLEKMDLFFSSLFYVIPSAFVLFLSFGLAFSIIFRELRVFYYSVISAYAFAILMFSIRKDVKKTVPIFYYAVLTHLAYGLGFLYGLAAGI